MMVCLAEGKVKICVFCLVVNTPFKVLRYGTRSQGTHSFTCTPRVHLLTE